VCGNHEKDSEDAAHLPLAHGSRRPSDVRDSRSSSSSGKKDGKLGDPESEVTAVMEAVDLLLQSAALERRGWSFVPDAEDMYQRAQAKRRRGLYGKGQGHPVSALQTYGSVKEAKSLQHAITDLKGGNGTKIEDEDSDDEAYIEMKTNMKDELDGQESPTDRPLDDVPEVMIELRTRTEKSITLSWDQSLEVKKFLQAIRTMQQSLSPGRGKGSKNIADEKFDEKNDQDKDNSKPDDGEANDRSVIKYDLAYRPKVGNSLTEAGSAGDGDASKQQESIPWGFAAYKLVDTTYTVDDLMPNTLYEFKCKRAGWGPYGSIACARTAPSSPSAPTHLIPQEVTATSIMVGWQPVERDNGLPVLDYVVRMKAWGGEMKQVYQGKGRLYLARELSHDQIHIIEVFARNRLGQSKACARLAVRTLSKGAAGMTPWEARISHDTGKLFFYHQKGKETAWELPEGALMDEAASFRNKREFIAVEVSRVMKEARIKMDRPSYHLKLEVARKEILYESLEALNKFSHDEIVGGPCRVRFAGEEGIDAGGLAKDWFTEVSKALVNSPLGLMQMGESGLVSIHPCACIIHEGPDVEWLFRCVGTFIAKAIMDSQTTGLLFSPALLRLLAGRSPSIDDLRKVEPAVVTGLQWVMDNDVTDADLTFTASIDAFGMAQVVELVENGAEVNVTEDNKKEYTDLMKIWIARGRYEPAITHMIDGFQSFIQPKYTKYLTMTEFQSLLGGQIGIEVTEIRRDFQLTGGFDERSDVVVLFWKLLDTWDTEKLAKLLAFVTGCSSMPVDGLQPSLTITKMHIDMPDDTAAPQSTQTDEFAGVYYQDGYYYNPDGSVHGYYAEDGSYVYCQDQAQPPVLTSQPSKYGYSNSVPRDEELKERHQNITDQTLPRAHTCFNQLVLPNYSSMKVLSERLTYALDNTDAGFYMS
jgi:hypothetical protein